MAIDISYLLYNVQGGTLYHEPAKTISHWASWNPDQCTVALAGKSRDPSVKCIRGFWRAPYIYQWKKNCTHKNKSTYFIVSQSCYLCLLHLLLYFFSTLVYQRMKSIRSRPLTGACGEWLEFLQRACGSRACLRIQACAKPRTCTEYTHSKNLMVSGNKVSHSSNSNKNWTRTRCTLSKCLLKQSLRRHRKQSPKS